MGLQEPGLVLESDNHPLLSFGKVRQGLAVLLQGTEAAVGKLSCGGVKASEKGQGHYQGTGQGLVLLSTRKKAATWLQEEKESP